MLNVCCINTAAFLEALEGHHRGAARTPSSSSSYSSSSPQTNQEVMSNQLEIYTAYTECALNGHRCVLFWNGDGSL